MLDEFSLKAHKVFFKLMASDPSKALLACVEKDNLWGWDIEDLLGKSKYQFSIEGCGTNECRGTVMVHGQCHWASDVNYFLWGLSNHLCASAIWRDSKGEPYYVGSHWFTEDHAVNYLLAYRVISWWYGDGTTTGRLAWTRAGYHGNTNVPATGAAKKCGSCGKKANGTLQGRFGDHPILGDNVFIF